MASLGSSLAFKLQKIGETSNCHSSLFPEKKRRDFLDYSTSVHTTLDSDKNVLRRVELCTIVADWTFK